MSDQKKHTGRQGKSKPRRLIGIIFLEILALLVLFGVYRLYITMWADDDQQKSQGKNTQTQDNNTDEDNSVEDDLEEDNKEDDLTPEEQAALEEQERLQKEINDRLDLVVQADRLALGYDYEGAIELIQNYKGSQGDYKVYPELLQAIERLGTEEATLLLYGGSYQSVTEVNHIFFHSLIADNSKAFDSDYDAKGYNMYMATIPEFNLIIQKLYDDGYVLVNMSDLTKKVTLEDGSTKYEEGDIYLREGKKPIVISQDDVSYYEYMNGDGFATRIILGEDGRATCEMLLEDGTITTGAFDVVPLLDDFVEQHPDFSYKGAKGLLAVTGYEGVLGYRTNNPDSPNYAKDCAEATKVAKALKEDGWEFSSHSWGHKNMLTSSIDLVKRDTRRWMEEVAPILGETDIFVFPFGVDMETTIGTYAGEKYQFLKENGFRVFVGVYSKPWMHVKKDYVRMTRRPIDGQAMLEFPDRLIDLFNPQEILDPDRPSRNW